MSDVVDRSLGGTMSKPSEGEAQDPAIIRRFMEFVQKSAHCWTWTGSRSSKEGYGLFYLNGHQRTRAHRVSWELFHKEKIPIGMNVCHHCDNPGCINPSHLFIGTDLDNTLDMIAKGRFKPLRGSSNGRAKLRESDIPRIRELSSGGLSNVKIAGLFGVSPSAIDGVQRGIRWKHV